MSLLLRPGLRLLCSVLLAGLVTASPVVAEGQWTTIFYKRAFVGTYNTNNKEGAGTTVRMPVTLPPNVEKLRVWLRSDREKPAVLAHLDLIQASETKGAVTGPFIPVLFSGSASVKIDAGQKDIASDLVETPLAAGRWYLESYYSSDTSLYTYDSEGGFSARADLRTQPDAKLRQVKGAYVGNVYRVDVFSEAPKPGVICYGDSITQGYQITAFSGNRYPDALARLLDRPVLNLGVNSDFLISAGAMPQLVDRLKGATQLIFLMGTNDLIFGKIKDLASYKKNLGAILSSLKKSGKYKVYVGTILPAGGFKTFDKDPAKEALRQEINTWIRQDARADGVIDFDAALRDPKNPARLRADYQCGDWVHPSDTGAQKMAETAAAILKP